MVEAGEVAPRLLSFVPNGLMSTLSLHRYSLWTLFSASRVLGREVGLLFTAYLGTMLNLGSGSQMPMSWSK